MAVFESNGSGRNPEVPFISAPPYPCDFGPVTDVMSLKIRKLMLGEPASQSILASHVKSPDLLRYSATTAFMSSSFFPHLASVVLTLTLGWGKTFFLGCCKDYMRYCVLRT